MVKPKKNHKLVVGLSIDRITINDHVPKYTTFKLVLFETRGTFNSIDNKHPSIDFKQMDKHTLTCPIRD